MNESLIADEQEFSWSLSRENLFNFCQRAYFYHYYGAAGGFEEFSGRELLYELKQIQSLDLWINSLCGEVLRYFFYENQTNFNLRKTAKRYFYKGTRSLALREWQHDPQKLNLFESYYGLVEINELTEYAAELLDQYLDSLEESALLDYLKEIPYLDRKNFSFPLAFNIGRIKVWCAPQLIWQEDGLLKFLTLNRNVQNETKGLYTAALHKFYACNKLRIDPERVVSLNFDLTNSRISTLPQEKIILEKLINHIKENSIEMLVLMNNNKSVYEDDFLQNVNHCSKCKFQKYCKLA